MGAFSAKNIASNTVEDGIDEGVSNLVYAMGNHYFGDGTSDANSTELVQSAFDEALEGAGQTLKFSIMNAVIFRVTEYAITKVLLGSSFIYTYIKSARLINTVKRSVQNGLGGIPLVGKFLGGALTTATALAVGNQNERLAMADMANNNINNLTTVIAQERQTATMQVSHQKKQVMSTLGLNHEAKGLRDNKKIEAYHYKMKTGTWTNTTEDKKLFQSVVPKEYIKDSFNFNTTFVQKLNEFTEYATDTENKLVNIAQTNLNIATTNNLASMK